MILYNFNKKEKCVKIYLFDRSKTQLTGKTIDEVKEHIDWFLHKQERDEVIERLREDFDMSQKAAEFVLKMVSSFHICEGAAIRRISDYLNANNYC